MQNNTPKPTQQTKEHPDLFKKVLKGGFWVFALRGLTQILSIVRLTVLARLLTPNDFGILGIAMLMISTLETLTETGFGQALIQKKKDITPYLNTAWTLNLARGLVLFLVLLLIAPLVQFLPKVEPGQESLVINIVRVTALCVLINGFRNIGTIFFQKELEFNKSFLLGATANIASVVVSIAIAIIYRSVWALVLGRLFSSVANVTLSYVLHPYRPKLDFHLEKAHDLWGFGKWITASTILGFIMTQGDDFFVMVYLGPTALGLYQVAYRFATLPIKEFVNVINTVIFPTYSLISESQNRLQEAYLKVIDFSSTIGFFAAIIVVNLIDMYVDAFMGIKWKHIIIPTQILSIVGLMGCVFCNTSPFLKAINKHNLIVKYHIIRICMIASLIFLLAKHLGIIGVALSIAIPAVLIKFWVSRMILRIADINISAFIKTLYPQFLAAIIATFCCFITKNVFESYDLITNPILLLSISFFLIVIIYFGIITKFGKMHLLLSLVSGIK